MRFRLISKILFLILLVITSLSCDGEDKLEERARLFLTSLQNLDIDKCIEMSYVFQSKLAVINNEPQFKKDKLIENIHNEFLSGIFNQYEHNNIVYVFRFPCQWQIIETKYISQESSSLLPNISTIYRVFVSIKYNSINSSPESAPLINNDYKLTKKIKEIILHCDFDPDTGSYLEWGVDSHTQW